MGGDVGNVEINLRMWLTGGRIKIEWGAIEKYPKEVRKEVRRTKYEGRKEKETKKY